MKKKILLLFFAALLIAAAYAQDDSSGIFDGISRAAGEFGGSFTTSERVARQADFIDTPLVENYSQDVLPEHICLSLGKYAGEKDWLISESGAEISYGGNEDLAVKFFILCDESGKIRDTIPFFPQDKINLDYVSHCRQFDSGNDAPACAVVLTDAETISRAGMQPGFLAILALSILELVPLALVLRSERFELKGVYALKLFALIVIILGVSMFYSIPTLVLSLAVLLAFFMQAVCSIAAMIFRLASHESRLVKLSLAAVFLLELVALIAALLVIEPLV